MASMFQKATKKNSRLRLALSGASGSGKSWTSLKLGSEMTPPGKRFCAIDTERGSLSKYSDVFDFDVVELASFDPIYLINILAEAEAAGYHLCVVDSLSHFWVGKDGELDKVDAIAKRSKSGSSFNAWREVSPLHNQMIDAILQSGMHIIATMRVKTEYVLEENDRGKTVPKKVGLKPIQRDGVDYEFDVVGDMDDNHNLTIGKTRCQALDGKVYQRPGKEVADILKRWLTDGVAPAPTIPILGGPSPAATSVVAPVPVSHSAPLITSLPRMPEPESPRATPDQVAEIRVAYAKLGKTEADIVASAVKRGADCIENLSDHLAGELLFALNQLIDSEDVFGPGTEGPQVIQAATEAAVEAEVEEAAVTA